MTKNYDGSRDQCGRGNVNGEMYLLRPVTVAPTSPSATVPAAVLLGAWPAASVRT